MDVERFFRKPVRQLRDLGASTPSVSVKRNRSLLASRQPLIVTAPAPTAFGDKGAGSALIGSGAAGAIVGFSAPSASAMAVTASRGPADSAIRFFWGFSAEAFCDESPARGATTLAAAAGAATGVVATGSGTGATSDDDGTTRSGCASAGAAASCGDGRRDSAIATTSNATMAAATICGRIVRRTGAGEGATEDGSEAGCTGVSGIEADGFVFSTIALTGLAARRRRDLDVLCVRRAFSPPTSANTSNVQRTRRPALSGGILIARLDTVMLRRNPRTGRIRSRVGGIARPPITERSFDFQLYAGPCTVRRAAAAPANRFVSCSIWPVRVHLITAESPESRHRRRG